MFLFIEVFPLKIRGEPELRTPEGDSPRPRTPGHETPEDRKHLCAGTEYCATILPLTREPCSLPSVLDSDSSVDTLDTDTIKVERGCHDLPLVIISDMCRILLPQVS